MEAVHQAQRATHGDGHDYESGSPHLKHRPLQRRIVEQLHGVLQELAHRAPGRPVEVLEVGAGHGPFTGTLLSGGARVTVTEMSPASVEHLQRTYGERADVRIVHDPEASWAATTDERFDLVVCISVLHHVPDYLAAIDQWSELTRPGGSFVSWQDPLLYRRVPKAHRLAARASYYGWRVGQGDLKRGAATVRRRMKGVVDIDLAEDMTEYHVVRDGVDEVAIGDLLRSRYEDVRLTSYWSTQSTVMQRIGERLGLQSEFSVLARGRLA